MIMKLYLWLYKGWMTWPQKLRFLLVGGYNTIFSYALFSLLLWMMNGRYEQIALALSFALSTVNSFWTQKIYVFASRAPAWPEFIKCLETWSISYVLNAGLLWELTDGCKVNPYMAQGIALTVLTIFSWIMLKYFAFKSK